MSLKFIPKPHQKKAIAHLLKNPCSANLMDMGLGKTACMLKVYETLRSKSKVSNCLVVAPILVMYDTWPDEIKKWRFDITYTILHGKNKDRNFELDVDLYLLNFEGLQWFDSKGYHMDMLIIDEATKIKNTSTKRYKILKRDMNSYKYRYCLSGKPAPNGLKDLFGQMYIVGGDEVLGRNITHFRNKYYTRGYMPWDWQLRAGAEEEIYKAIKPWSICMRSEDYIDLPEKIYNYAMSSLSDDEIKNYKLLEKNYILEIQGGESVVVDNAAALSIKLRQMANGAVYTNAGDGSYYVLHNKKIDKLREMLAEMCEEPVIVAYEFRHDLARIKQLCGDSVPVLGSGTPLKTKKAIIKTWNTGGTPILFAHGASISHGLNLQHGGRHLIWFSVPWDLDTYDQCNKRLHRPGQESTVFIHHICVKNTIDSLVIKTLQDKDRTQSSLLDALKIHVKNLSK